MKRALLLTLLFFLTLGISSSKAIQQDPADPGKKIGFQGNLYENGEPVTGERQFIFKIDLGSDQSWTETQKTSVLNGLYSVVLGAVTPLPYNLFFEAEERIIQVSIGNTVLGSSVIYAPFALKNDNEEYGTAIFQLETKGVTDTVALTGEIYGKGNNSAYAAGLRGFAHTDTTSNTGVSGIAFGGSENKAFNTAVRGDAYVNTQQAWATGILGRGNSQNGGPAFGVRGEVHGTGATFSAATRGLNFMEAGENGIRYGGYFNTFEGNTLYIGESIGVRGNGGGSVRNSGVIGEGFGEGEINIGVNGFAYGAQENIGVLGRTTGDGENNFSAVFENSPVKIRNGGRLLLNNGEDKNKAELFINAQNAGALHLKSSVDSTTVLIDSNGEKAGLIYLNDSLARPMFRAVALARGAATLLMSAGYPETGLTSPVYQLVADRQAFSNMILRNDDQSVIARIQTGITPGSTLPSIRILDPNSRSIFNVEGSAANGGQIYMDGPNSSNLFYSGKHWEGNADLPFLALRGSIAKADADGNGNTYNDDMAIITVNRNNNDGSETGELALKHVAADGTASSASMNYFQLAELLSRRPFNGG
ncbi:MAG: hypothetical protein ACI9Z3_001699, partial [Roseivirga sp.]